MESSDALMARFLALHPRTIDLSWGGSSACWRRWAIPSGACRR